MTAKQGVPDRDLALFRAAVHDIDERYRAQIERAGHTVALAYLARDMDVVRAAAAELADVLGHRLADRRLAHPPASVADIFALMIECDALWLAQSVVLSRTSSGQLKAAYKGWSRALHSATVATVAFSARLEQLERPS